MKKKRKGGTGRPPKMERNKELVEKRLSDPNRWTFRALGEHYGINWKTAEDIFKIFKDRFDVGEKLSTGKF